MRKVIRFIFLWIPLSTCPSLAIEGDNTYVQYLLRTKLDSVEALCYEAKKLNSAGGSMYSSSSNAYRINASIRAGESRRDAEFYNRIYNKAMKIVCPSVW